NKGGLFNNYNRNKLGITLNMRSEKGREIADRLIADSGIVTENFAPGVMERWGITWDHVQSLRSDAIYARMSGYGHDGPHHEFRSYGPVIQAACGLSFNSGLPGREPSGWGMSYMDNLIDPAAVEVPFILHPDDNSHQKSFELKKTKRKLQWVVALSDGAADATVTAGQLVQPDGRTSIAFVASIANLGLDIATNDAVRGSMTLQKAGGETIKWKTPVGA
ncbi:MAG: hypothetical protein EON54_28415, partial [Alcaligenaceae bacterium]